MDEEENCWEFMRCGREAGGMNAEEQGVCPVYTQAEGSACWFVAGTFSEGQVLGSLAKTRASCVDCEFYKRLDVAHKARVSERFYVRSFRAERIEDAHDSPGAHREGQDERRW